MMILPLRNLGNVFKATIAEFDKDQVGDLAAALTYYALLSLFPLLLLLIIGASLIYEPEEARRTVFSWLSGFTPGSTADVLSNTVAEALDKRGGATLLVTIIGIGGLLFSASGVFNTVDKSINRAWGCEYKPSLVKDKVTSFLMMLGVVLVMVISLTISATLNLAQSTSDYVAEQLFGGKNSAIAWLFQILSLVVTIVLNTGILIMLYRSLPRCKVKVRDVWLGALLTAVSWEILKQAFAFYLGISAGNANIYGSLGAFFFLITWIWLTSVLLLMGAEFTSEYAKELGRVEARRRVIARRAGELRAKEQAIRVWRGDHTRAARPAPPAPAPAPASPPPPPEGAGPERTPGTASVRVVGVAALASVSLGLLLRGVRTLTNHKG